MDLSFPRLITLACHDLRTPLATVSGFAHTLARTEGVAPPADRFVEMIVAASEQIAELLEEVALAARVHDGRYEPHLVEVDSFELATAAAGRTGGRAVPQGTGTTVRVDREAAERSLAKLAVAAVRHGGLDEVRLEADGAVLSIAPVTPEAAPVVAGDDLKDLGAAVGRIAVAAMGGSLELDGDALRVHLPQ